MNRTPVAVAILLAAAGACGGYGEGEEQASPDESRYCTLVAEVEAKADELFGGVDNDTSEADIDAAREAFIEDVDEQLDEMDEVAPAEIADDVRAYNAFTRAQMRGEDAEEVSAEKIGEWEKENCSA